MVGAEHVDPFHAARSELLVLVVQSVEPLLEVQELQVQLEGMLRDNVIAKAPHQCDLVSVEDCEHFARGRSQLVRTLRMQNCWTKHLHSRDVGHMGMCIVIVMSQDHC